MARSANSVSNLFGSFKLNLQSGISSCLPLHIYNFSRSGHVCAWS